MARSINQVNLMGRLTRDPELRTTTTGKTIASFSIAVDRQSADETTDFFDVTCWNNLAEIVSKYVGKGSKVHVSGRLQLDRWETDGQKKSKVSVIANDVVFLDSAADNKSRADSAPAASDDKGLSELTGGKSITEKQKEVGTLDDAPINLDDIPF